MLVGEHFIHWIAIYTLDRVIHSLNNREHNNKIRKQKQARTFLDNFITVHVNLLTHLSCACKLLDGFQFGSKMITTLAHVGGNQTKRDTGV